MVDDAGGSALEAVAALAEPTRRALYEHVTRQGDWVSREQAADAVGIQRTLAAHHLDRLAAEGVLEVEYRRTGERRGPGGGRPAKLYRRSERQFDVTLPPRRYELAARILAEAADAARRRGIPIEEAVDAAAERVGQAMAGRLRAALGSRPSRARARGAVLAQLGACGFEPIATGERADDIALRNCPFHDLARDHTDLVCGMNLTLLARLVAEIPEARLHARLAPQAGACCVRLDSPGR